MKLPRSKEATVDIGRSVDSTCKMDCEQQEESWENVVLQKLVSTLGPLLPKPSINNHDIDVEVLCAVRGLVLSVDALREQLCDLQQRNSYTASVEKAAQDKAVMDEENVSSGRWIASNGQLGNMESSLPNSFNGVPRVTYGAVFIEIGDNVEGNHRNRGHWQPGIVAKKNKDNTFTVIYEDGEVETYMSANMLRYVKPIVTKKIAVRSVTEPTTCILSGIEGNRTAEDVMSRVEHSSTASRSISVSQTRAEPIISLLAASWAVGANVEANLRGEGRWYPGRIGFIHSDGTFYIDYDDGETEARVEMSRVRHAESALQVGCKVEGNYRGKGRWYPVVISRVNADGTFNIDYDDAAFTVPPVPVGGLIEGAKVEGNYRGKGKWYFGRIAKLNLDGTYNVDYDDGEKEQFLRAELVRLRLSEGDKVEGNYKGKRRWYPGRMSRVNADSTVNVDYDDGEKETRMESRLVRVIRGSTSLHPYTATTTGPSAVPTTRLELGSRVEAKIAKVNSDGTFNIDYDNYQREMCVSKELVRASGSTVGECAARARAHSRSPVMGSHGKMLRWHVGPFGEIKLVPDDREKKSLHTKESDVAAKPVADADLVVRKRVAGGVGDMLPGRITCVHGDGTFDVFDDNLVETRVPASLLRRIGSVPHPPVTNAAVSSDNNTDIDGEYPGCGVKVNNNNNPDKICEKKDSACSALSKVVGPPQASSSSPAPVIKSVSAPVPNASVAPAQVSVELESEPRVPEWFVGDGVECYVPRTGMTLLGQIHKALDNHEYDVAYYDGGMELGVPRAQLRRTHPRQDASRAVTVGAQVQGNYRGEGRWYPATVSRVHLDGTYDIEYLDVKEKHVNEERVRLVTTPAPLLRGAGKGTWMENNV